MKSGREYELPGCNQGYCVAKLMGILRFAAGFGILMLSLIATQAIAQDSDADESIPAEESAAEGESSEGNAGSSSPAMYLPIKPAFVVNYGGAGRLKYLKTEMSVRIDNMDAANSIRHHLPFIRNNLVMLFARQTDETLSSQEGKEALRRDALTEIRKIIKEEDDQEGVVDVFFNTFIVQK